MTDADKAALLKLLVMCLLTRDERDALELILDTSDVPASLVPAELAERVAYRLLNKYGPQLGI